jgi:hypothetical protein
MPEHRPPSTDLVSFNCPHCGALAHQTWYSLYVREMERDGKPFIIDQNAMDDLEDNKEMHPQIHKDIKEIWSNSLKNFETGNPFFDQGTERYLKVELRNVWISRCYSRDKLSLWLNKRLLHPAILSGDEPTEDMPDSIRADYEEARLVLASSPRAAAALLRLCIQKLCGALGESGKDLNKDIGSLASKGLDTKIQRALDIVRVVGNNAAHPGQIDVRDNPETARNLFSLVNLIIENVITRPKHILSMYESLPAGARDQIEKRDDRAASK